MTLFSVIRYFRLLLLAVLCLLPLFATAQTDGKAPRTVLVFGDSLSAGYGMQPEAAWPSLLQKRLQAQGLNYSVANLSISGETTAGGRTRLAAALSRHRPAIVVFELGANDGLRGLPLKAMRDNLEAMISTAQAGGAKVLLIGMRLPPNYGAYADAFNRTFRDIAQARKVARLDFLLAGIADQPQHFQPDGLHPNAEAQVRLLDNVWPALRPLLRQN